MCRQGVKDLLTSLQDHRFSIQHVFHCYSHVLDHRSFDITYISDLFKKHVFVQINTAIKLLMFLFWLNLMLDIIKYVKYIYGVSS